MSRRIGMTLVLGLLVALAGGVVAGFAQGGGMAAHGPVYTPKDMAWSPGPPSLNPGAQITVLEGDPSQTGPFTLRLKVPDGYKVMPHWHPTAEHVTVISGMVNAGMGDTFDKAKTSPMPAGSFATMPAKMNHYIWTKGPTIIQVHAEGPFQINYVNPADDPSKASGTKP